MSWLQQTDEQQRQDEEEIEQDWMNWTAKEPPRWKFLEWAKWKQEQENDRLR